MSYISCQAQKKSPHSFSSPEREILSFLVVLTQKIQGPPTRNTISRIAQKCTFLVYSNKALRIELSASPTSLHSSVHLSENDSSFIIA